MNTSTPPRWHRPLVALTLAATMPQASSCKPRQAGDERPLATVLAAPAESAGGSVFDVFDPSSLRTMAAEAFERYRLNTSASLLSFNLTDMAGLSGSYGVDIRRLGEGAQQRQDRWRLATDILPGTLLQDAAANTLPVSIRIRAGREVVYIRNFADKRAALLAAPKSPLDLPLNAEKALAMAPGDFVSLPVYMGLSLGLEKGSSAQPFSARASTGVFWQGEFCFNVYRQDDDHIRIKVAPSDARGYQFSTDASAHLDMFGYGPFGLVNLDRQAERALGLDFFRYSVARTSQGEKMAIDYVFDLRHPDGRLAYDTVLQRTVTLKAGALASQGLRGRIDHGTVFADLTPAEYLHVLDEDLPAEQKRVARVFRGARFYEGTDTRGRLGTRLLRWEGARSLTFNWVTAELEDGRPAYMVTHMFSAQRKQSSWFSTFREQQTMTANAIFAADPEWRTARFDDLLFDLTIDDSEVGPNERNDARAAYQAVLGDYYDHLRMDAALMDVSGRKLRSFARIGIQPDLFRTMLSSAQRDTELFEKQLWYALWVLTPRFEGRLGPRSPGAPANVAGLFRNLAANTLQTIRTAMSNVIRLQWEGIHGTTVQRMVDASANLPRTGEFGYLASLMRLMERDESAQEIVPAYLLTMAQLYRLTPFVQVGVDGEGIEPWVATYGTHTGEALHTYVSNAFHSINHLGYER